jgi:hypothetical protein
MLTSPNLLAEIQTAYAPGAETQRGAALASLRKAFLAAALTDENGLETHTVSAHGKYASKPAEHGIRRRRIKQTPPSQSCSELQLVEALRQLDHSRILCLLAEITRVPFAVVAHVFLGRDHKALLIVARANNFAWSTMRLLVSAHQARFALAGDPLGQNLDFERLATEFDEFPRPVAERAMRFIRAFALAKQNAN